MNNILYKCIVAVCLVLTSCGGGCKVTAEDPFEKAGIDFYGEGLPATLAAYNDLKTGPGKSDKQVAPAMYVDFSAGMFTAFGTPLIRESMSQCFNTVLAQQFEVYKLAQGQVSPLEVSSSTQLGQIVSDPKQYLDRRAPIQAAVEKIVASRRDALLITDFEEWQNNAEITSTAYLKIPFSKWLSEGNSISFFIADYQEGTVAKHIYFTVFSYGRASGNSLIDKLRPRLSSLPAKFDLATDAYLLTNEYPGAKTGGIFHDPAGKSEQEQNVLDLQPGYINGLTQNRLFEYYPLGLSWATVAELQKEYAQQNQFTDLLRKLYIDLSNTDSYVYENLEVKTYNVTGDFERYVKSVEVEKHKPAITKGNNGEDKVSDQETDVIALTCYDERGVLKPEFRYEPVEPLILNDLFMLNADLFKNTRQSDQKKAEIGIAFSPQFSAEKITGPNGLVKISLNVSKSSVNASNPVLEKFKWVNSAGVSNISLYESVKSTLDEVKPLNKPLYSYYIKTTEQ